MVVKINQRKPQTPFLVRCRNESLSVRCHRRSPSERRSDRRVGNTRSARLRVWKIECRKVLGMRGRGYFCNTYPSKSFFHLSIIFEPRISSPLTFLRPSPSSQIILTKSSYKISLFRPRSSPRSAPPLFVAASERRRFPLRPTFD